MTEILKTSTDSSKLVKTEEVMDETYISGPNGQNLKKPNEKYREASSIIKISEIEDLLRKYNIGKEPLAILLGWGEKTILRYFNGLTPLREYSDKLKELSNPLKMKDLYDRNKDRLTEVARKKLEKSIIDACVFVPINDNPTKVMSVSNYFLNNMDIEAEETITPLKLQKLVYYAQAWAFAFLQKPLFAEDFQAWVHGPVIPGLYLHYKNFGFSPIPKVVYFDENIFNPGEKEILAMVHRVYGKYDPGFLERLTHLEEPWKKARGKYGLNEKCTTIIEKEDIKKYYSQVKGQIKNLNLVAEYVNNISINC